MLGTRPIAFEITALTQPRFGALCAALRKRANLTLRQVASRTDIPRSTLSRLERGGDVPLSVAVKILAWGSAWY